MFEIIDQHHFGEGDVIWEEGSFGDWIYLIESGQVELSQKVRGEKVVVDTLTANEILGEVGYITQHPRIFTAIAREDTKLGIVDRNFLDEEYNHLPENFKIIMRSIAKRLIRACEEVNLGRKSKRSAKTLSLAFKNRESLVKAFTANASEHGLMIKTPDPLPRGEIFFLRLSLPKDPEPIELQCEVVWSRLDANTQDHRPSGMGVKFLQISNADKARLAQELKNTE